MERGRPGGFRFTVFSAWMTILFLTLPLLIVVPVSFTPQRYLSLPGPQWSLRHYGALLADHWSRLEHSKAIRPHQLVRLNCFDEASARGLGGETQRILRIIQQVPRATG